MSDHLLELTLDKIDTGERFRKVYEIDDLVESIQEKGVLQPITVCRSESGYRLMAGGRRLAAAKAAGLSTIPCLIREIEGELDLREIEYVENAYRKDLTWQERMNLVVEIHRLMKQKFGGQWNQRKTAQKLDRNVGGINRLLQLKDMIDKFPDIAKEETEDAAVKKARQVLEAVTVQALTRKHEAAAVELEKAGDSEVISSRTGKPLDSFETICRRAKDHYRIGDAFEEMEAIIGDPDLNPPIALVEVDPPYGIDLKKQKKGDETRSLNKYEEVDADDYTGFTNRLIQDLYDITPTNTRIIYWFAMEWYDTITRKLTDIGFQYDPIPCIWVKPSGQTNSPETYLARAYETFLICWKGDGIPIRERGRANVFNFPPVPPTRKFHPTQRPVELMREILKTFGWPNNIVLIPFLGSGATLRACYAESMIGFGWELNAENKPKFLAAVEQDIETHYSKGEIEDDPDSDIPF